MNLHRLDVACNVLKVESIADRRFDCLYTDGFQNKGDLSLCYDLPGDINYPNMDVYSREKRSEVMSKVRSSGTGPEMTVRRKLHSLGFRYRLHGKDLPGKPDIVLPKHRSIVFVHGCFWHHHTGCPKSRLPVSNADFWEKKIFRNVRRDERSISELQQLGWRVLVIWECDIRNGSYIEKLTEFLSRRAP